jgi:hypothetical protein
MYTTNITLGNGAYGYLSLDYDSDDDVPQDNVCSEGDAA